jgi:hypothetical protein
VVALLVLPNGMERAGGPRAGAGSADYDLVYFDASVLSYAAEDAVIRRAAALFGGLSVSVEVRNQTRVHVLYEEHFGTPGFQFCSSSDAIDHFPATATAFGRRTRTTAK